MIVRRALFAILLAAAALAHAETSTTPAQLPGNVSIAQKLGSTVPLQLMFRDETGGVVHLDRYFHHGKPVLLQFVYYNCPMLCPMVLEGTTTALTQLKFDINKQFDVITVSMDPRDKPAAAMQFKEKYLRRYGRLDSAPGWHFLTGNESAIQALADALGFQFAYDGQRNQFAHGAALMILTPEGVTSRYFYGFEYKPRDLRLAIVEASAGKVGNLTDQFLLLCYHYDPAVGKYSRDAMTFARAGGVATVACLGSFIFLMLRGERRKSSSETTP